MDREKSPPGSDAGLKPSLGLTLITLYGLGNILGAGIYVLIGEVVAAAGMGAPLAFILAAIVAALSAFTYGQLAARFPVSAGEAVYVHQAFDLRWLSMAVGLMIAPAGMVSSATLARGLAGYFQVLVDLPDALVIVVVIVTMLALWFPLVNLAGATSFLVLTVFGIVNLTLVVLKRRRPRAAGVIPCPLWVPMAGAGASFGLLVALVLR